MEKEWIHEAIIQSGKDFENKKYRLLGYNIWDYEWDYERKFDPINVVSPHDGNKYELNIVSLKIKKNHLIRFGYIIIKRNSRQKQYFDYGIYLHEDDLEWKFEGYPLSDTKHFISGVNIWDYTWFEEKRVKLKDPLYNQDIEIDVNNIYPNGNKITFGVYEAGEANWVLFKKELKGEHKKNKSLLGFCFSAF